jgi:hypothetical protein
VRPAREQQISWFGPHPVGTTEEQQVAAYFAAQLRQQGFQPSIVSSAAANPRLGTLVPIGRITTACSARGRCWKQG